MRRTADFDNGAFVLPGTTGVGRIGRSGWPGLKLVAWRLLSRAVQETLKRTCLTMMSPLAAVLPVGKLVRKVVAPGLRHVAAICSDPQPESEKSLEIRRILSPADDS
jgi:hypothetical protein